LRILQGRVAMLSTKDLFPSDASALNSHLRKLRKGWGTHCLAEVGEIKIPTLSQNAREGGVPGSHEI
jgi:hypothetical protein